jgi:uncharacterized BrkB/YihY/UPF0761 family membrane protein
MRCTALKTTGIAYRNLKSVLWPLAMLILLLATSTAPAFSQACAMCYSTAAATSKDGQRAITRGVVVLVAPPLGVMTLGVGLAFRYGRKRDEEQNRDQAQ